MALEPTEEQRDAIDACLNDIARAALPGDADAIWAVIAPMVLEAAAGECDRLHDTFAGTAEGRGINRGAGLAADRIRALKGTP